jgi:hypothetical protein
VQAGLLGNVTIERPGYYQVTFGVMPTAVSITTVASFHLVVNGVSGGTPATLEFIQPAGEQNMYSMTTFIQTTNTSSSVLINNGGTASTTLNNAVATSTGGPAAYLTIVRLQ